MDILLSGLVLLIGCSVISSLVVSVALVRSSQINGTYLPTGTEFDAPYNESAIFQVSSLQP